MVVDGLLVEERIHVEIEMPLIYVEFWFFKFGVEEVYKYFGVGDDFGVLDFGAHNQTVEQFLHFLLEIYFFLLLDGGKIQSLLLFIMSHRHRRFLLRNIQLFRSDVEVLQNFGYDFTSAITALHLFGWPLLIVKLKIIFDPL
jgi:hypothetical protein